MYRETQNILKVFEEEDEAISVFDLSKRFSNFDAETIDSSVALLQEVGFIEQTGFLQWRLTDDCRRLGNEYKERANQTNLQIIQILEQQIDFDQEHFQTCLYINDKRTITFALLFATLLIFIFLDSVFVV